MSVSTRTVDAPSGTQHPRLRRDLGRTELINGLVGFVFSCTGPVAVILAVGANTGLSAARLASWVTAVFAFNGILTIVSSWRRREPLVYFWTIPGTVVVGQAMSAGTTWSEVIGGFIMAGVLMVALAATGQVERIMRAIPPPIVMAMVAGVFLSFGTGLVEAVVDDVGIAGPTALAYVVIAAVPPLARWFPPVLAALVVGAVVSAITDPPAAGSGRWIAEPVWQAPTFGPGVLLELAIPLVVTVIVVQNGQGMAVLRSHGHHPPMNRVTFACGTFSLLSAPMGGASTCLAGPTNALVTAGGSRHRHYAAALWCGLLAIGFGLLAPGAVQVITTMPESYVAVLGGLALLPTLKSAFGTAFCGQYATGALVCFLVTVTDFTVLNIGAAFWGLVAGVVVTLLLDPEGRRSMTRLTSRPSRNPLDSKEQEAGTR